MFKKPMEVAVPKELLGGDSNAGSLLSLSALTAVCSTVLCGGGGQLERDLSTPRGEDFSLRGLSSGSLLHLEVCV